MLTLAVMLIAVDGTLPGLAVAAFIADLGPTATQILWIADIYTVAIAGLLVTMDYVAADGIDTDLLMIVRHTAEEVVGQNYMICIYR